MQFVESIPINKNNADLPGIDRPIRILQVVGGMNRAGVETWLMHVLRNLDRQRFQMDFLVHTNEPTAYDAEILTLGSKIIPCLSPLKPHLYAYNFQKLVKAHGPYDIVHSHVHHFSGYVLWLANRLGIPVRIAHSHLNSTALEAEAGWIRRLYLAGMKLLISRNATLGLGCSQTAKLDLLGQDGNSQINVKILHCGIDLTPFQESIDPVQVRTKLGIPPNAFVVGHVGRFQEQKNHRFILEIFVEIAKHEPEAYLLLVGEGSLHQLVRQHALQTGLIDQIIFLGVRSDIPRLMLGAIDVFLFPSICEGLGLVLIEAQAAGLPCVVSDVVPEEVDVVDSLIRRLSLIQSASEWADMVLSVRKIKANLKQKECLKTFENDKFDITYSIRSLINIYAEEINAFAKS